MKEDIVKIVREAAARLPQGSVSATGRVYRVAVPPPARTVRIEPEGAVPAHESMDYVEFKVVLYPRADGSNIRYLIGTYKGMEVRVADLTRIETIRKGNMK